MSGQDLSSNGSPWRNGSQWARGFAATLISFGLALRILPLVRGEELLMRQPTEDGYLLLAVARNIAIGLGMSTAAGTIPTNGVQPLITFLDAACFFLAGGDKVRGVAFVMGLSVLISVLSLIAVYRLARVVFASTRHGDSLSLLASALWFASPVVLSHSMNALETGLNFLMLAITTRFFLVHASDPDVDLGLGKAAMLGGLLGVAFWTRNDIILFLPAIVISRLTLGILQSPSRLARRGLELTVTGAVMLGVAAPWMISNAVRFGSIVPISGKAESTTHFGVNLPQLPAKLVESLTITGAIPNNLEIRPPVQLACGMLILVAVGTTLWILRKARGTVRTTCVLGLTHAGVLATFYGVFFGAGHFLSRYLSPISVMCAFLTVGVGAALLRQGPRWATRTVPAFAGLVALITGVRQYQNSHDHMHFQVVDWVRGNVASDVWVGAIQTGTLGFFHDRTINLDGKTNPAALRAKSEDRMREYVLASDIQYLVDWVGIADWQVWLTPFFDVVVRDPQKNLAVLHRVRQ